MKPFLALITPIGDSGSDQPPGIWGPLPGFPTPPIAGIPGLPGYPAYPPGFYPGTPPDRPRPTPPVPGWPNVPGGGGNYPGSPGGPSFPPPGTILPQPPDPPPDTTPPQVQAPSGYTWQQAFVIGSTGPTWTWVLVQGA